MQDFITPLFDTLITKNVPEHCALANYLHCFSERIIFPEKIEIETFISFEAKILYPVDENT